MNMSMEELIDTVRLKLRCRYRRVRNYEKAAVWEGTNLALVRFTTQENRGVKSSQHILLLDKHAWATTVNNAQTPLHQLSTAALLQIQLDSIKTPEHVYTSDEDKKHYGRLFKDGEYLREHTSYYQFQGRLNKTLIKKIIVYAEQRDKTFETDIEEEAEDRVAARAAQKQCRLEQKERDRAENEHEEQQRRLALQQKDRQHQAVEDRVRGWALANDPHAGDVSRYNNEIRCGDIFIKDQGKHGILVSLTVSEEQDDLEAVLDALKSYCCREVVPEISLP